VIGVGPKSLCAGPRGAGCEDEVAVESYSLYGGGVDNPFRGAPILAGRSSDMGKDEDVVEQG
jgi:hypothetical protein